MGIKQTLEGIAKVEPTRQNGSKSSFGNPMHVLQLALGSLLGGRIIQQLYIRCSLVHVDSLKAKAGVASPIV